MHGRLGGQSIFLPLFRAILGPLPGTSREMMQKFAEPFYLLFSS